MMDTILEMLGLHLFILAIFYSFYRVFLSRETFFVWNRWILILGMIASVTLPFFRPAYVGTTEVATSVSTLGSERITVEDLAVVPAETEGDRWPTIILTIYSGMALLLLFRFLFQAGVIFSEAKRIGCARMDGLRVVDTTSYATPFSFFHLVFINLQRYAPEERAVILAHEKAHIRQQHWADLLLIQMLKIALWINPFVWWYEKLIKQNHEYLADAAVLRQRYDRRQYQAFVLKQILGGPTVPSVGHFFAHLSKNRFQMMNQQRSKPFRKWRAAGLLPLLAIAMWAFAQPVPHEQANLSTKESQAVSVEEIQVKGRVMDAETGAPLSGASVIIANTTSGTITDREGRFLIRMKPGADLAISYVGYQTERIPVSGKDFLSVALSPQYYIIKPTVSAQPKFNAETGEKEISGEVFRVVEALPYYGDPANQQLFKEVNAAIRGYTDRSAERGVVTVHFMVEKSGQVSEVRTYESSNPALNETAENIIRALGKWTPGRQRGQAVDTRLRLLLNFE